MQVPDTLELCIAQSIAIIDQIEIEKRKFTKRHTSSFFAPNFHVDVNDLRMRTYKGFVVHLFHSRKLNASFSQITVLHIAQN